MYTNVKRKRRKITFFPSSESFYAPIKTVKEGMKATTEDTVDEERRKRISFLIREHFREVINTRKLEYQQSQREFA